LIVDEALSVGDAAFQRKCFARIESLKKMGATILFVSHSETLVIELCDRAILLEAGSLIYQGKPKFVMGLYNRLMNATDATLPRTLTDIKIAIEKSTVDREVSAGLSHEKKTPADESYLDPNLISKSAVSYEPNGARIVNPNILNGSGDPVNILVRGQTYVYTYDVHFDQSLEGVRFSFLIKTISGLEIGGIVSNSFSEPANNFGSGTSIRVSFRFRCLLKSNLYFLNAGVLAKIGDEEVFAHRILDLNMFRVQPIKEDTVTGVVDFRTEDFFQLNYLS
jgi:lipopolysaccharide transport system ATP-binding protein